MGMLGEFKSSRSTSGKSPGNRRERGGKGRAMRQKCSRRWVCISLWLIRVAWGKVCTSNNSGGCTNSHVQTGGLREGARGTEKFYFAGNLDCVSKHSV